MAHLSKDTDRILARVKRIQGQLGAVANALESGKDCSLVLQTLAACRGALNGLTVEILEDHIRVHIVPEDRKWSGANEGAVEETIEIIRSYLK